MARTSKLDNPEFCRAVAMAYVEGFTREAAAEEFDVTLYTITRWFRDPRVQAIAGTMATERMLRVVRKTDSEVERRLLQPATLTLDELIKVRKEFAPKTAKADEHGIGGRVGLETTEALQEDPELAEELEKMIADSESHQDAAS